MVTGTFRTALFLLLVLPTALSGCGGGNGGSAKSGIGVGGTVSGLEGTLVLQNNGTDDLTLTSDGTFTFATAIATGSSYVSNGAGTVSMAGVKDVTVACFYHKKAWTNPSSLDDSLSPARQVTLTPRAAMGDNGDAIVVWAGRVQ